MVPVSGSSTSVRSFLASIFCSGFRYLTVSPLTTRVIPSGTRIPWAASSSSSASRLSMGIQHSTRVPASRLVVVHRRPSLSKITRPLVLVITALSHKESTSFSPRL